jgi:hypothetical protein
MHSLIRDITEMHVQNDLENIIKILITSSIPRNSKQSILLWKSIFMKPLQMYKIIHTLRIPSNY